MGFQGQNAYDLWPTLGFFKKKKLYLEMGKICASGAEMSPKSIFPPRAHMTYGDPPQNSEVWHLDPFETVALRRVYGTVFIDPEYDPTLAIPRGFRAASHRVRYVVGSALVARRAASD